ncbi:hypothetical protein GOP47_0025871 [Adiantum capillus-veneris]|uniref:Uncharacterized protein n=1 Tax=Adiantum capillus-veneris TaxID=13818 RepID=A0A9D4U1F5_ADICA|nr:hypothetical protein GOP47_0025871 [Adiantum capillus-veneris]
MSLREWCEAGHYLVYRFDPNIKGCGFLLWEKNLIEEKNWKTSFDGLLKAEKEIVTPSSAIAPPTARPCNAPSLANNKCRDCLVLIARVLELESQVKTLAQMQAQIAPLQAVVMKHNKVLRRMCLDAAKAKVMELAKAIDCELQGFLNIKYLDPHIRKIFACSAEDSITDESLAATGYGWEGRVLLLMGGFGRIWWYKGMELVGGQWDLVRKVLCYMVVRAFGSGSANA